MLEHIMVSYGIPLAYLALGVAALGAVVFPIIQMVQDLKKAVTAFVAIGIILVVFLGCYALSANEPFSIGEINVAAGQMRFIEAGIYLFYLLLAGSVLAILITPLSRYLK